MKYSKYKDGKGFFAGKGFYFVLAFCIVAVLAAAGAAVSTINSAENSYLSSESDESQSYYIYTESKTESIAQEVRQPVSDVPDTRTDKASSQENSETADSGEEKVYFKIPVAGNIGKAFSDSALQYSKTYGDMRLHQGVDLQAEKGTEVVSAAKGKVTEIVDDGLWGRMVVIDHENGIVVYYCGLENLTVSEGETVKAGTPIGAVGVVPCECEDESHIHIAVEKDGKYISPLDLLSQ